jgi:hypothetical protein
LEGGPPMFNPGFTRPSLLEGTSTNGYRAVTFCGPAFQPVHSRRRLVRVRSPLLTESLLLSFPAHTEMFQFCAFALQALCIQA